MAYVSGELRKIGEFGGNVGGSIWAYDTADANATVYAAGYITDAWAKGMQKGDVVHVRRWTTTIPVANTEVLSAAGVANILLEYAIMPVIGISTAGAADLANGTLITMTNT